MKILWKASYVPDAAVRPTRSIVPPLPFGTSLQLRTEPEKIPWICAEERLPTGLRVVRDEADRVARDLVEDEAGRVGRLRVARGVADRHAVVRDVADADVRAALQQLERDASVRLDVGLRELRGERRDGRRPAHRDRGLGRCDRRHAERERCGGRDRQAGGETRQGCSFSILRSMGRISERHVVSRRHDGAACARLCRGGASCRLFCRPVSRPRASGTCPGRAGGRGRRSRRWRRR